VVAILIATVGVVITALRPGGAKGFADLKPTALGLVAAACFALSAVGFRGAIIAVPGVSFVTAASYTLVFGLFVQTAVLTNICCCARPTCRKEFLACGDRRCSLVFWVRSPRNSGSWRSRSPPPPTFALALVEVLFAHAVSYYSFKPPLSLYEFGGIVLIVIGVGLLVAV